MKSVSKSGSLRRIRRAPANETEPLTYGRHEQFLVAWHKLEACNVGEGAKAGVV